MTLLYRLKNLFINIKFSFLKFFGWEDIFHNGHFARPNEEYTVCLFGKTHHRCSIKKHEGYVPEGMYDYYVETKDGCHINISYADMGLYKPKIRMF